MSCAAQIEEIDSSKEVGSATSAGTRFFRSSMVRFGSEVEVGCGWVGSESDDRDPRRDGGVLNLTTCFAYGRGRL